MKLPIALLLVITLAQGIRFKFRVKSGETQCFTDELAASMLLAGDVKASSIGYQFELSMIVNEKEESIKIEREEAQFQFEHVTDEAGTVQMCFESLSEVITFDLSYETGGEALDMHQIAQKGQMSFLNVTIGIIENTAMDITREKNRLIEMETIRNNAYVDISTKIIGFGGITFGVLLIIAACQVIYVKRYFVYKKII